jgi:hypothetical protein
VSGRLVLEASMSGNMFAVRNGREVGLEEGMLGELVARASKYKVCSFEPLTLIES